MVKQLRAKWNPNPVNEQVTSYRLSHQGTLLAEVPGDQAQYDFDLDATGINEFALSAVNATGEGPAAVATYDLGLPIPSEPTQFLIELRGTVTLRRLTK